MNPEINLLPVFEKRKPESYLGLILFIVVLGALILFLAMYLMGIKQDAADLAAEEQSLILQRAELQNQVDTAEPEPEISYSDAVLFVELNSFPASPFIEEMQRIREPNQYIHSYSFTPGVIGINADFETKSDIAFFVESLMKSNYFEDVQVDTIQEFDIGEVGAEEGLVEEAEVAPRYTTSIRLIPLPEYTAQGGTQP